MQKNKTPVEHLQTVREPVEIAVELRADGVSAAVRQLDEIALFALHIEGSDEEMPVRVRATVAYAGLLDISTMK